MPVRVSPSNWQGDQISGIWGPLDLWQTAAARTPITAGALNCWCLARTPPRSETLINPTARCAAATRNARTSRRGTGVAQPCQGDRHASQGARTWKSQVSDAGCPGSPVDSHLPPPEYALGDGFDHAKELRGHGSQAHKRRPPWPGPEGCRIAVGSLVSIARGQALICMLADASRTAFLRSVPGSARSFSSLRLCSPQSLAPRHQPHHPAARRRQST